MAKGLRSSTKKANKTKLRSRVFGPVENARTERLSAKLLELASKPKPAVEGNGNMDVEPVGMNPHTYMAVVIVLNGCCAADSGLQTQAVAEAGVSADQQGQCRPNIGFIDIKLIH